MFRRIIGRLPAKAEPAQKKTLDSEMENDFEPERFERSSAGVKVQNSIFDWRVLILLLVAVSCLLAAELISPHVIKENKPDLLISTLIDVLREGTVAFFIAFVVVVLVENRSKKEMNEAVQERIRLIQLDVFYSTFERHIPKRTVAEVNALVFTASFVRLWHLADYTLRIVDMSTIRSGLPAIPLVELEQVTSYAIRNVDSVARPLTIYAGVERPPFPSLYEDQSIVLTQIEWGGLSQKIPDPQVEGHTHYVAKRYEFGVLEPGATVRVELRARLFKLLNDYEVWRSVHPTDNVTLTVHLPREPVSHNVFALHRLGLREVKVGPLSTRYETRGAMLPYQGILIWWRFDPTALGPLASAIAEPDETKERK